MGSTLRTGSAKVTLIASPTISVVTVANCPNAIDDKKQTRATRMPEILLRENTQHTLRHLIFRLHELRIQREVIFGRHQ